MPKQKKYFRLDKAERVAIERGLDAGRSARAIACALGRSVATITKEVYRNRFVCKGPGKGELVEALPEGACPKLCAWPHVCNGCRYRRYHCSKKFRCEYSPSTGTDTR